MNQCQLCVAVVLFSISARLGLAAPQIGDKAPPIKVAKWVTQQPPALPGEDKAKKHVYLVEFWATWCPPCLTSIPHLAKLQKKHKEAGLVVIGISNEDIRTIQEFIDKKQKMAYCVASDDEMETTSAWTKDIEYIPHAFLVDRSGVVVWQGAPVPPDVEAMDKAIEQVLAGKYDIEAAKRAALTAKKFEELAMAVYPAYVAGDRDKLFELLDQMIALKPLELHPYLIKRDRLREFDMADSLPVWDAKILETFKDSAVDMRRLAEFELQKDLAERSPKMMLHCALRADELTKGGDAEALVVLARVQCELGMLDSAIATQEKALAAASKEAKERSGKVLAYYKTARKLGLEQ